MIYQNQYFVWIFLFIIYRFGLAIGKTIYLMAIGTSERRIEFIEIFQHVLQTK